MGNYQLKIAPGVLQALRALTSTPSAVESRNDTSRQIDNDQ